MTTSALNTRMDSTRATWRSIGTRVAKISVATWLPIVGVALWWIITEFVDSFYFPPLSVVLRELKTDWISGGAFTKHALPTLFRFAVGFGIAAVLGVILGLAIGSIDWLRRGTAPIVEFARSIPASALIPIFIVVIGVGDTEKVVVVVSSAVWPVLLNTIDAVREMDPVYRDVARVTHLRRFTWLGRIVLPAAAPRIALGCRIAISISLIVTIVAEMIASNSGIGFWLITAQQLFEPIQMWSGVIILGVLGLILNGIFEALTRRIIPWNYIDNA